MNIGTRVRVLPHANLYPFGLRYGDVVKIGRKYIHIYDSMTDRTYKMLPHELETQ